MTTKPTTRTVANVDAIPAELKALPQWVLWRWTHRKGKWTKPPFQPSGVSASSTDPATWVSFAEALAAYQSNHRWDGIGYMLTGEAGIVGIDYRTRTIAKPESTEGMTLQQNG